MKKYKTILQYIKNLPKEKQKQATIFYGDLKKLIPGGEEAISYGMPTFRVKGKNLVHFAVMKNHLGFYPTSSGVAAFEKEIAKKFKYSKGAIQIPLNEKLPMRLITKIVKFRLKQVKDSSVKK